MDNDTAIIQVTCVSGAVYLGQTKPKLADETSSSWKVTQKIARNVGGLAAGVGGLAVGSLAAPGLSLLPLSVAGIASSAMGVDAAFQMDAVQTVFVAPFLGSLAAGSVIAGKLLLGKAANLLNSDFWERALKTPLVEKALAVTDKLRSWATPVEVATVALATAAVTAATTVAGGDPTANPAAMAVAALGVAGMASLDKLRAARQEKRALAPEISPTTPKPGSGSSVAPR